MTPRSASRKRPTAAVGFVVSLVLAASLGGVLYLVVSSLPYLLNSPSTDVTFGGLNRCVQQQLKRAPTGLTVSADARALAASGDTVVALCHAQSDGGATGQSLDVAGVSAMAFDFSGGLWLAQQPRDGGAVLLRADEKGVVHPVGEVSPMALVGVKSGVVALEGTGRLLSLGAEGSIDGVGQLPKAPLSDVSLSASADGERVALVAGTGIFVWKSGSLQLLRAEGPCAVEFLWWRTEGHRAVLSCGPKSSWALEWDLETGASAAAQVPSVRSTLVPRRGVYLQGCEGLACTAPAP